MSSEFKIQPLGTDLRKYRTEVPNLILEMGLSVYELALYIHLKRTAGDQGESWKGTRRLSEDCRMALGSIVKAKAGLEERGLIEIHSPSHPRGADRISITDIWEDNFYHFMRSPDEQCVHQVGFGVSPGEQRNKPLRNINNKSIEDPLKTKPEQSAPDPGIVFMNYEQEIGPLTPMIASALMELQVDYTEAWVVESIRLCSEYNKRSLKYAEAILKNWERDGRGAKIDQGSGEPEKMSQADFNKLSSYSGGG